MSSDCIFCKIVAGEIPCARIYESEDTLAFLDIAPVNAGHALVVPKKHYVNLWELPESLGAVLLADLKRVSQAVMDATGAHGLNLGMNNHAAAGQLVMHAHFHLIPRFEDDGLTLWSQTPYANPDKMNALANTIRASLK
ncbi:MAG: HIT family protein [Desulfovibrionaceae bacterium]